MTLGHVPVLLVWQSFLPELLLLPLAYDTITILAYEHAIFLLLGTRSGDSAAFVARLAWSHHDNGV